MEPKNAFRFVVSTSGMSKRDLSHALGKSTNYISSYTSRDIIPMLDTMTSLADVAGYDLLLRHRESQKEYLIDPPKRE